MLGAAKIELTPAQQDTLECCANGRTVAVRAMERAKIILGSAVGQAKQEIAKQLGVARQTVWRWEKRFRQHGTKGLEDAPRSGRPRRIQAEQIAQIVHKTNPGNSSRFHPLERAEPGPGGERESLLGEPDLAFEKVEASSGSDVQAQQ